MKKYHLLNKHGASLDTCHADNLEAARVEFLDRDWQSYADRIASVAIYHNGNLMLDSLYLDQVSDNCLHKLNDRGDLVTPIGDEIMARLFDDTNWDIY